MANKRILKKQIRYVCGDLAAECILAINFIEGINVEKMQEIVFEIAALQSTSLSHVSFSFDKIAADFASSHDYKIAKKSYNKAAFRTLKKEFDQKVQDIVKSMNNLLPQAQKDANKQALNK